MIRDTSPAEYHIDNLIDECSYILSGKEVAKGAAGLVPAIAEAAGSLAGLF